MILNSARCEFRSSDTVGKALVMHLSNHFFFKNIVNIPDYFLIGLKNCLNASNLISYRTQGFEKKNLKDKRKKDLQNCFSINLLAEL